MKELLPPFAPTRPTFPCPGLLALASRASLGGERESILGAMMAARLASGLRPPYPLDRASRGVRAEGARLWLGALTLPAKVRTALLRAFAASAGDDPAVAADAIAQVTEVTAPHLDRAARSELVRLVEGLREQADLLAGARARPVE